MKAGLNTLNPSFIFAAKIKVTLKNPQILTDRMDVFEHELFQRLDTRITKTLLITFRVFC